MYTSLEDIDIITREYRESIIHPDGSLTINNEHLEYMNTIHFDIPKLEYDVLLEIPRYLVRTTMLPRDSIINNKDKIQFLTWMAEICDFFHFKQIIFDSNFNRFFDLLISSYLAEGIKLPSHLNFHLMNFYSNFNIFVACFAFPFLERCIRMKCKNYVDDKGNILQNFEIPYYNREGRSVHARYRINQRISNITHELKLMSLYVASPDFKEKIDGFLNELNEDSGERLPDAYELISQWRNTLLHGEKIWGAGRDASTYLICMIMMSEISKEVYDSNRDELIKGIKWKQRTNSFLWYTFKI